MGRIDIKKRITKDNVYISPLWKKAYLISVMQYSNFYKMNVRNAFVIKGNKFYRAKECMHLWMERTGKGPVKIEESVILNYEPLTKRSIK